MGAKHTCFSDVFEGFHTLQGHYLKFLHERFSALLLALTLYNIYIYQHKTCSVSPLTHCEVRLLILCTNFVYILAALWRIDTTT